MTESTPTYRELQEENARLRATVAQQQQALDELQEALQALRRDLALLKRSAFGHRRERFEDPRQGTLFAAATIGEAQADAAEEPNDPPESKPGRRASRGRGRRVTTPQSWCFGVKNPESGPKRTH